MLALSAKNLRPMSDVVTNDTKILRVASSTDALCGTNRESSVYLIDCLAEINHVPEAAAFLIRQRSEARCKTRVNCFELPAALNHLTSGDVVRLDTRARSLRVLYRVNASINSLLVTERCNSFCVMCSQPPRDIDDSYRVKELASAIALMPKSTRELMFSGGEPTLLGGDLFHLLALAKEELRHTAIHVLTNGRNFKDPELAASVARLKHPDLMFGIPLYSDVSEIHDFVVQAAGAFDETIRGILNLKRLGQKVELRVVIHRQTFERLPKLADFIATNLLFVDQVALMGLELMGFGRTNADQLWIDPVDYSSEIRAAAKILERAGIRVLIFNHQLCTLPVDIRHLAVKSISDWKQEFLPECGECSKQVNCGGFFSSVVERRSRGIHTL